MKDAIVYMIDYLPDMIEVKINGHEILYRLEMELSHSRGLKMFYRHDPNYGNVDSEQMDLLENPEINEAFVDAIAAQFGEGARPSILWRAEYIRSMKDFRATLKACRQFLAEHNLAPERVQDVAAKEKLFQATVSNQEPMIVLK